ncbi:hypothetical protein ANO14919_134470 [Xylariales sp. No.14919]|nr:hypothetical protein ANO14919_134470 [Xylariales sp. No.14919]
MADATAQQNSLNESAMRAAEEELRRRRERGKLSQARFRKRQAESSRETRQENERMKAAIADIVKTTQRGSDRSSLLKAVRAAADVAGVDVSGLDEEDGEERVTAVMPDTDAGGPKPLENETGGYTPHSCFASTLSQSSGRLSPRLDYGIWVDPRRAAAVSRPPTEIIPFLGAGRYTFSGQLYWACTEYLISLCRVVTTPQSTALWFTCDPRSRPSPREAETRLQTVLQHSPPIPSVRMAQALAEAHREYRDRGYFDGDSPACNAEIGTLLRQEVEAPYVAHGRDLSVWMNITELETHMRRQLGAEAFSRLENAVTASCTSKTSKPVDEDVRAVVRLLIKNLAESYTCFGDGPRWRTDCVSALFSEKVRM